MSKNPMPQSSHQGFLKSLFPAYSFCNYDYTYILKVARIIWLSRFWRFDVSYDGTDPLEDIPHISLRSPSKFFRYNRMDPVNYFNYCDHSSTIVIPEVTHLVTHY